MKRSIVDMLVDFVGAVAFAWVATFVILAPPIVILLLLGVI